MKRIIAAVVLIFISSISLFSATEYDKKSIAGGEFISCPLESATATITSPLPSPWWTTPQIGKLQDVKVETVGGNKVLMCGYWAYSTTAYVMRPFPEGATHCQAEGNGFRCS
jgi:hypothetical protein